MTVNAADTVVEFPPAIQAEHNAWLGMPFLRAEGGRILEDWAPPDIKRASGGRSYAAECVLGAHYALQTISHTREFGDRTDGGHLLDTVHAIVERGRWTGVEIGFFTALDNYVAWGRVIVADDFDAWPCEPRDGRGAQEESCDG